MEPFVKEPGQPVLYRLEKWTDRFSFLTAGVTSREGGVSQGDFSSLNCGLHVADRPDAVIANRRKVAARLGVSFEALTFADQVHGNDIAIITERERGMGRESMETALQKTDGFVSNVAGVVLCAMFADCVPLYFVDPVRKAVGLAHAGWKGTVLRIAEKTVRAMTESFGSRPEDILGAVGPSIGVCCYEVDQMVIDRVKEALGPDNFGDAGNHDSMPFYERKPGGKYMLNLQHTNRHIMIKAGILPSHIEISNLCTSCQNEIFFSHRKEGGKTGRIMAYLGILQERHQAGK